MIDPAELNEAALEAAAEFATPFGTSSGSVTIDAVPLDRLPDAVAAFLNHVLQDDEAMRRLWREVMRRPTAWAPKQRLRHARAAFLTAHRGGEA